MVEAELGQMPQEPPPVSKPSAPPCAEAPPAASSPPGAAGTPSFYKEEGTEAAPRILTSSPGGPPPTRRGSFSKGGPSETALRSTWGDVHHGTRLDALHRRDAVLAVHLLLAQGLTLTEALDQTSTALGLSLWTLRAWWRRVEGLPKDLWPSALVGRYQGRTALAPVTEAAWEWFKAAYLDRSQPEFADIYRRAMDLAPERGWRVPSEAALRRRFRQQVDPLVATYLREGSEALRARLPQARVDKTGVPAGQAMSLDGLKLDSLWVQFPGETPATNAAVALCARDIHSGRIVAGRLGETECTDLICGAVYDLLGVCWPETLQIDNTRAMANKCVTGQSPHRHRFKNNPWTDPVGLLVLSQISVYWTNPDTDLASPGQKPVERSFRDLHKMVRHNPRFHGRGFSTATAVPSWEVEEVLAEEIVRYNAIPQRRTQVCGRRLSYDQAWEASVQHAGLRRCPEETRDLWRLRCEVATINRRTGEIALRAGVGPHGAKPRYAHDLLYRLPGEMVTVWFDPDHLDRPVQVRTMDGGFLCVAEPLRNLGFQNTADARVWKRMRQQKIRAVHAAADAHVRMEALGRKVRALPGDAPLAPRSALALVPATPGEPPPKATPDLTDANQVRMSFQERMEALMPPSMLEPAFGARPE